MILSGTLATLIARDNYYKFFETHDLEDGNMNNVETPGVYFVYKSMTNVPVSNVFYVALVLSRPSRDFVEQILFGDNDHVYSRMGNGHTFHSWITIK